METKEFTVPSKLPQGRERTVTGRRVDISAGRAAFDLETGRTVQGPATIWQAVGRRPKIEPKPEAAPEPKRRGRPKTEPKPETAPPEL